MGGSPLSGPRNFDFTPPTSSFYTSYSIFITVALISVDFLVWYIELSINCRNLCHGDSHPHVKFSDIIEFEQCTRPRRYAQMVRLLSDVRSPPCLLHSYCDIAVVCYTSTATPLYFITRVTAPMTWVIVA